jgi:hypothetical protein
VSAEAPAAAAPATLLTESWQLGSRRIRLVNLPLDLPKSPNPHKFLEEIRNAKAHGLVRDRRAA